MSLSSKAYNEADQPIDDMLTSTLAEELGCDVILESADESEDPLVISASDQPGKVLVSQEEAGARYALALPFGGVATWSTDEHSPRIVRHARCAFEREAARIENARLVSEVDSLASQVMQDFEELSLIRTLASHLEIPQTNEDTQKFVLESLRYLAGGVGAVSIAAVLCGESPDQKSKPVWTDQPLTCDEQLIELVNKHAKELQRQPVVRNSKTGTSQCDNDNLSEYVMVECSSEGRLHGWIIACNRLDEQHDDVPWAQLGFTTVQASLMETAANQLAAQLNNVRLLRQKEELFTDVIRALVNAVEARDPYTCGHSERVAGFARCLGAKIGFTAADCERIYLTGLLHDVGKIAIPDGVLQKPNRLNDEERAIIETHTDSGWRILQELDALQHVLPGVLYHHEHWDGNGYPDQLEGENIPIDGRILAVCDAFDAMTSDRPYRRGMSIEKAVEILSGGSGTYWDPRLIHAFIENIDEIDAIRCEYNPRQPAMRPEPVDGKPVIRLPEFVIAPQADQSQI